MQEDAELTNDEQQEGVIVQDDQEVLTLELEDSRIIDIIGTRVEDSKTWWDKQLNLTKHRELAERYYFNQSFSEDDLYEHQVPYKDNRIIIDVETLCSLAVSNPAEPVVTEANDTDASRQLAMDLGNVLTTYYEDLFMKAKLVKVARHLMMGKRTAVLKYWFDPSLGKILPDGSHKGAIVVENRRPEKIVVCQETGPGENPLFIAEYLSATVDDLIHKFPDKKDEIFREMGFVKGTAKQLNTIVGYIEFWFTYYGKDGNPKEGVAWKLKNTIMGKMANPNWNYDGYTTDEMGKTHSLNFFDQPLKPYIFFSHIDTDEWFYDETALIDHVIPLQDVLNKRGRQIVENADQASGGIVYNTQMISEKDMAKVIGDPSEKLGVDGNVQNAVMKLPYNQLPNYVIQDKFDARAEIDNIFGSNAPIKGESSGLDTLGQEILSQRANLGRLQPLADAIEDGMDRLYKALVQMMKVWLDEPDIMRFTPSEGKTQFINFSSDKIEDGVKVRVKAGSALPKDKFALRNETIQTIAILDPLSIAEGLDKANPMEFAKRITFYRFFMDRYMTDVLGEGPNGVDQQAAADIQMLTQGQTPEIPADVSKEYLATFDSFMRSDGFKQLEPGIKKLFVDFVLAVSQKAKADMGEKPEERAQIEEGGQQAPAAVPGGESIQPAGQSGNILSRAVTAMKSRLGAK